MRLLCAQKLVNRRKVSINYTYIHTINKRLLSTSTWTHETNSAHPVANTQPPTFHVNLSTSRVCTVLVSAQTRHVQKTQIRFGFGIWKTKPSKNLTSVQTVFS